MYINIDRTSRIRVLAVIAFLMLLTLTLHGQTGYGVVKGTVQDASRAAIPNAQVTLTNTQTNVSHKGAASGFGIYYFPSVPQGQYRLDVEAAGFKRWSGNLTLGVGQTAVIDPVMEVGSTDTKIEVKDVAPVIHTSGMEIGDVKDGQRIDMLPLNSRLIQDLYYLTPGMEDSSSPRANGLKLGSVEVFLDGSAQTNPVLGYHSEERVAGLGSIAEFRVETNGSDARYSNPASVTLVTKSGTNDFHGDLMEQHRNNSAGLRTRTRQDGNAASKYIRNEFSISSGGPLYLPKLYNGRNRTFWFFNYEGGRMVSMGSFRQTTVPTAAMWGGDFSQIIDTSGRQTHIYDPLTTNSQGIRQPFAGDIIPANRINAMYTKLGKMTIAPSRLTNPYQGTNFDAQYPYLRNDDVWSLKGDHRISDKDSLSVRFTSSRQPATVQGNNSGLGFPARDLANPFGSGAYLTERKSGSLTQTHIFSPSLFSELLLTASVEHRDTGSLADDVPYAKELGLPTPFSYTGWPNISAGFISWRCPDLTNQHLARYSLDENLTWLKGKHSVRFGGRLRYGYYNIRNLATPAGSATFGATWTALYDPVSDSTVSRTGDGLAAMALGLPTNLSIRYNREYFYLKEPEVAFYFNDSWKATRRLTLELGLRWDRFAPATEKYNRSMNVDPDTIAGKFQVITPGNTGADQMNIPQSVLDSWAKRGLTWTTAQAAGYPANLLAVDNNNIEPRLGLAFKITDKTVLRAGYGEYFWTTPVNLVQQRSTNNPPLVLTFTNDIGTLNGVNRTNRITPLPEYYVGQAAINTAGVVTLSSNAQSAVALDGRNWKDDRVQSWHFTIERELPRNTSLRLSYQGNHARDLEQNYNLNSTEPAFNYQARTGTLRPSNTDLLRVNPNWSLSATNKTGYSNTHSLQSEVNRQFSNGLAFQWYYVFTRSLSTVSQTVPENFQLIGAPSMTYDQRLRLGYYNDGTFRPHAMRWNGVYDLPFGKGKHFASNASGVLNQLVGGWQVATIGSWTSGSWLGVGSSYLFGDPTLSSDQRMLLTFNGRPQLLYWRGDFDPTLASNVSQEALQKLVPVDRSQRVYRPLGSSFDNKLPQTLANGTVVSTSITDLTNWNAKNFIIGPRAWNTDLSFFKNIRFTEKLKARFTVDFFNFFNHPNDGTPNTTTGLVDLSTQANEPRIIQFSLHVSW